MTAELLTDRLSLRRPAEGDVAAILAVHSDPLAYAHNPGDRLADLAEARALYQRWHAHWERYGFGYWVVRTAGSPDPIGFCGVKVMTLHGREVLNLLYRFAPAAWGHGYATEAAGAVVAWAADQPLPLTARVRPANTASQAVATKVGLTRTPALDTEGEDGLDWLYVSRWP